MKITKTKVVGLGINFRDECDQCTYCWNADLNKRFHPKKVNSKAVDRDIKELWDQLEKGRIPEPYPEKDCQFYNRGQWDIIISHCTDPFHRDNGATPHYIFDILRDYPEVAKRVRVLTKRDCSEYLRSMDKNTLIGATITTLSEEQSKEYQPHASTPTELMGALQRANREGFKTWLVIEPYFSKMRPFMLVKDYLPFLSEVWIGRLNHKSREDYDVPNDQEIIEEYKKLYLWAQNNRPNMKVMLKKQLGGGPK